MSYQSNEQLLQSGIQMHGPIHSSGMKDLNFNGPDELDFQQVPNDVIQLLNESTAGTDFHKF